MHVVVVDQLIAQMTLKTPMNAWSNRMWCDSNLVWQFALYIHSSRVSAMTKYFKYDSVVNSCTSKYQNIDSSTATYPHIVETSSLSFGLALVEPLHEFCVECVARTQDTYLGIHFSFLFFPPIFFRRERSVTKEIKMKERSHRTVFLYIIMCAVRSQQV